MNTVRQICLSLPYATERLSHGTPSWYIQDKRQFVMYWNNHHNDGRLGLWMAAPMGAQQALISEALAWFFVPPYVAHRGWIGVLLDKGLSHDELADLIVDAYRTVAPAKLAAALDASEQS